MFNNLRYLKLILLSIFFITALSITEKVQSVSFASDIVHVYENGKQITDNSVIWKADYGYTELCKNGVCSIGQQFYPVTIYKTSQSNLTEGDIEFDMKIATVLQTTFNPGQSIGVEYCEGENCIGGRIGSTRTYNVHIDTGKILRTDFGGIINKGVIILILILIFLVGVLFLKKKKVN